MPPRKQFYDPFVEAPKVSDMSQDGPAPISAFHAEVGMYLHINDVVATLRYWAKQPEYGVLGEAADMFADMATEGVPARSPTPPEQPPDPHPEVARIEVYPDLDGRWHARPVSNDGSILVVTEGSFDRDFVERDANERWPEKQVFELADAMGDSIWDEQDHSFGFNGRRRPSPRRLWA